MRELENQLKAQLTRRRDENQLRARRIVRPIDAVHVEVDGRRLVNFASNNYLGLTHHSQVIAAARDATAKYGAGSGGAPLISGYTDLHRAAETALARWKGTEESVLLPSGYQANLAAVQALCAIGDVRFVLDKLVHASLIDAIQATGKAMRIFPHNHLPKLRRLLEEAPSNQMQVVITESIFSMDGDAASLREIVALKREFPFVLLLDEAHASGVYGEAGAGYANECGISGDVDVCIVTLSKAFGSAGGAICASRTFCDAVVNFGRAYVYSTSLPPSSAAASIAAIDVMQREPQRQKRVRELARRVREKLGLPPSDSPIIPIIVGEDAAAIELAQILEREGMLAPAIRPPTVARGKARVRITLSSEHSDEEVEHLCEVLTAARNRMR